VLQQDADRLVSQAWHEAIRGYQRALPSDITLLGAQDLARVGPIDLVIARWPCQGHIWAGCGEGLHDLRSRMFWEMLRVLHHLQTHQARAPTYILKNVPLLGDTRFHVMASVHEIRSWIGPAVLLDAAKVGSHAHRARLWWMNLLPKEVLR
jgi:site-specific DNA-cytosine methylase